MKVLTHITRRLTVLIDGDALYRYTTEARLSAPCDVCKQPSQRPQAGFCIPGKGKVMSSSCYGRVQDHSRNSGLAFCLLLALADWAHDDGYGRCPPVATLAHAIRVTDYQAAKLLIVLQRSRELTWDEDRGYYQINVHDPHARQRTQPARPLRKPTEPGYVYLVEGRDCYKIGMSTNVPSRVSAFGLQLPFRTKLIHSIPTSDMKWAESYLHHTFAHCRLNGEWFNLTSDDVAWICALVELEPE